MSLADQGIKEIWNHNIKRTVSRHCRPWGAFVSLLELFASSLEMTIDYKKGGGGNNRRQYGYVIEGKQNSGDTAWWPSKDNETDSKG
jgi:hypothetical protein